MPLILDEASENLWLQTIDENGKEKTMDLINPFPSELLTTHAVQKLRGKAYLGNIESISEELVYEELKF